MTAQQLFEFVNSAITGVITFFVNSQSVKKNIPFLESRFARIMSLFQNEEIIVMNSMCVFLCVFFIKQKEIVQSIENIMPGLFYTCSCDNE